MENKALVILTCRNRFFGQTRKPWSSLNVEKISNLFKNAGYIVEIYDFHELVNNHLDIKHKIIVYAFSQKENYRQYIKDIIYHLSKNNQIIPSYDLLKCHENKGYQEIYKKDIGLHSLWGKYFTSVDDVDTKELSFPFVLKTTIGSNGKGVYLIRNLDRFKKVVRTLRNTLSLGKKIDLIRRKYFRKRKFPEYPHFSDQQDYHEYIEYVKVERNFILQEYIPDLNFDYRVLIAFDRVYTMKRDVKAGDFRASGSKLFSFSTKPDPSLLNYAKSVYDKFDTPFLSIDVLFNGTDYYLVEYQALHFGMAVIAKSTGFFKRSENSAWEFIEEKPELEKVFARTYLSYLQKR